MVSRALFFAAATPLVAAYPWVMDASNQLLQKRRDPAFTTNRPNTGTLHDPPAPFNAQEQYVDVGPGSGHEFQAPGPNDLRGECPGLNAAANHAFLPRSGVTSVQQTITGLADAYNMSPDLSLVLAVVGVAYAGDFVTQTWSVGGAYPASVPLLGNAPGILGSHNKYENDASPVRGDAYLNGGDVGVFQMRSWEHLYSLAEEYTLDVLAAQDDYVTTYSLQNNPYAFWGPASGLVPPAAHNFIVNFMSNHSTEAPGGVLTREVLKTFFAVEGEPGSFTHNVGMERIPDNWYKRPTSQQYTLLDVVADGLVNNQMYPGIIRVGGNTGTTNSFVGVDVNNLTGGVYNSQTLLENNNLACFFVQASQALIPGQLAPVVGEIGDVVNWMTEQLGPVQEKLECPELAPFEASAFDKYPGGFGYKAQGE